MPTTTPLTKKQLSEVENELRREFEKLTASVKSGPTAGEQTERLQVDSTRRDMVAYALRRLHEGDYGTCDSCKEPIAFGRLLVMPEAMRCVRCAARG